MDDLPDHLLCLILSRLPHRSDWSSISVACSRFYELHRICKTSLRLCYGFQPLYSSLSSLCSRFCCLSKIEVDYSGWKRRHGKRLDDNGLKVMASRCVCLREISLRFCHLITDSGLESLASCKALQSVELNSVPKITGRGLCAVATGCKNLSFFRVVLCRLVHGADWLSCLSCLQKLEDLAILGCPNVHERDLALLGQAWSRFRRFQFLMVVHRPHPAEGHLAVHGLQMQDINCEMLQELRLDDCLIRPKCTLSHNLRKCNNLVKLHLGMCIGLGDYHLVRLARSCPRLKSFSLRCPSASEMQEGYRCELTDESLNTFAKYCKSLEEVSISFSANCELPMPYFSLNGILALVKGCQVLKSLALERAYAFNDHGLEALCGACALEKLELVHCPDVTDNGMRLIVQLPSLKHLRVSRCARVSDTGLSVFRGLDKLERLQIESCPQISEMGANGLAKIVHYSCDLPCCDSYGVRIFHGRFSVYP